MNPRLKTSSRKLSEFFVFHRFQKTKIYSRGIGDLAQVNSAHLPLASEIFSK